MRIVLTWLRLEVRRRWVSLAGAGAAGGGVRRHRAHGDGGGSPWVHRAGPAVRRRRCPPPWPCWPTSRASTGTRSRRCPRWPRSPGSRSRSTSWRTCCQGASTDFAMMDPSYGTTIERPVIIAGRLFDPSPGRRGGGHAAVPGRLPQAAGRHADPGPGHPEADRPDVRREPRDRRADPTCRPHRRRGQESWDTVTGDGPGQHGTIIASPGLYAHYPANMTGDNGQALHQRADPAEGRRRRPFPRSAPTWPG